MNKAQIRANFQAAHSKAVANVAAAQFVVMDAQATLANARTTQRELERKFKEDMANATESTQIELPLAQGGKK